MEKLTDEELDSAFKTAAEGNTPPYEATAWDAMMKKLDAPRPIPVWRKWSPIILVGVLVFFSGVWVGRSTEEKSSEVIPIENKLSIEGRVSDKQHPIADNNKVPGVVLTEDKIQTSSSDRSITRLKVSSGSIDLKEKQQEEVDLKSLIENEQQEILVQELPNLLENEHVNEFWVERQSENIKDDSLAITKTEVDSLNISKELHDKPGGRRVYGLFIRLLASPDLSSIKFGPTKLGSNIGVVGEFSFSDRISISTGVLRAKKNYESYQKEAYGSSARHLVGSCSILDVPVNLTYSFPSKSRFSIYTTVGASSYIMLREDYVYTIKSNTGDRVYPSQAIRKNNEWFKVLNVAVGLQYRIAPRWHIQLEPFIKAPLADLGERNVRLSSIGAFGALRYQLAKIKTP
ncbi:MAG: outer membrane beta-barrel protein [Cytophagales bacterium]|nr:outer membrane beta-barrel protein [Cytophagales bacterium]